MSRNGLLLIPWLTLSLSMSCHSKVPGITNSMPRAEQEAEAPDPFIPDAPQANRPLRPHESAQFENAGLIEGATIFTIEGTTIEKGYLLWKNGLIKEWGAGAYPGERQGLTVISGDGKFVTPGLIDSHSHMGGTSSLDLEVMDDINEMTNPVTPEVWAEHSFWAQDPALWRALAGGVTTIQLLPGSANLIGGRSFVAKLKRGITARDVAFPGARQGLKIACGENPKRVYGAKNRLPSTRMGNVAGYREAFQKAVEYRREWQEYDRELREYKLGKGSKSRKSDKGPPKPPKKNLGMDTLAAVLDGKILVHNHCYRADEMAIMLDLAQEFQFKIRTFHHALEAYKIAPLLAQQQVAVATWADWWGFKMEAFDGIPYNLALLESQGVRSIVHSDSAIDVQYLNQEAAKAARFGRELDLKFSDEVVLRWITLNPAWALGVEHEVGSLKIGKMADIVLWDHHPLSGLAQAEKVWIDGDLQFDRVKEVFPLSDMELGYRQEGVLYDGRHSRVITPPDLKAFEINLQPSTAPDQTTQGALIIRHVTLHSGRGDQPRPDQDIVIQNGWIEAVGSHLEAPSQAQEFDGRGKHLTPGFIAVGGSLGLVEVEMEASTRDDGPSTNKGSGHYLNPGFSAYRGFHSSSVRIAISRAAGITTVVAEPKPNLVAGMGFTYQTTGLSHSLNHKRFAMFASLTTGAPPRPKAWQKLDQLSQETLWYLWHLDQLGGGNKPGMEDQRFLTLAVHQLKGFSRVLQGEIPLIVHADQAGDMEAWIDWRREIESETPGHSRIPLFFMGGLEAWKIPEVLKKEAISIILTPSALRPSMNTMAIREDLASFLIERGVPVIVTTADLGVGRLQQEAIHAVQRGLPASVALATITGWPAQLLGLKDRGIIEPGRLADLVLWDHQPLSLEARAERVWIRGALQSGENRQKILAKRYFKKAP